MKIFTHSYDQIHMKMGDGVTPTTNNDKGMDLVWNPAWDGMGPGVGPSFGAGMRPGFGPGFGPGFEPGFGYGLEPGMNIGEGQEFGEPNQAFFGEEMDQEAMQAARFRQLMGIRANLAAKWKNENILGQFEFMEEDEHGSPIYKRKGKTSRNQVVYLYKIHSNDKWRIGPHYRGPEAANCWLYIKSDVADPTEIQNDQMETKELWHEHKKGKWMKVQNFTINFEE